MDVNKLASGDPSFVPGSALVTSRVRRLIGHVTHHPRMRTMDLSRGSCPCGKDGDNVCMECSALRSCKCMMHHLMAPSFLQMFHCRKAHKRAPRRLTRVLAGRGFLTSSGLCREGCGVGLASLMNGRFCL